MNGEGMGGAAAMGRRRRWLVLVVAMVLGAALAAVIPIGPAGAAVSPLNAEYESSTGTIWVGNSAGDPTAIATAVNTTNGRDGFVEMDPGSEEEPGSTLVMGFPDDYVAVPDGGSGTDVRVVTLDDTLVASAEILIKGPNGEGFTSVGTYPDDMNGDIDLDDVDGEPFGPVKYVKIVSTECAVPGCDGDATPGFDVDAVEALSYEMFVPNEAPIVDITTPAPGSTFGIGDTVNVSATIDDDGPAPYDCSIDWGDGTTTSGVVGGPEEGTPTCSGGKAYGGEGDFTITVTVTDDGGEGLSGSDSVSVSVVTDVITCGGSSDPCEEPFALPGGNEGVCDGCLNQIIIRDPGPGVVADVEVKGDQTGFALVITRNELPRKWWKTAGVDEVIGGEDVPLRRCTFRERLAYAWKDRIPSSACFYLTPKWHPRQLKYTILDPDDPRFRIR